MTTPNREDKTPRRQTISKWLIGGFLAASLPFAIFVLWIMLSSYYWQVWIGVPLEGKLGFGHGTPVITENGAYWSKEVLAIESVSPTGVLGQAGFKDGDIVQGQSINGLFKLLHEGRGKTVTILVVDGGDGPPIASRTVRTISFVVPK